MTESALWPLACACLLACSSSHREPGEPAGDAGTASEGCGASAACADGRVCLAGRCVAVDASPDEPARDAGHDAGAAVEQAIVWQMPLQQLPQDLGNASVDLVVGNDGDLWVLGQTTSDFVTHLWLDRMAPDGARRWSEPWTSEHAVAHFGIGRAEPIPAGFIVVDDLGRATVASTSDLGGALPGALWLSQVGAEGATQWMSELDGYYLSDLDIDDGGRVYAALGMSPQGMDGHPRVTLARWLPDATRDTLRPIDSALEPPLQLVVSELGGDGDTAVYLAGARPHPFGDFEAFVGRFDLGLGADT